MLLHIIVGIVGPTVQQWAGLYWNANASTEWCFYNGWTGAALLSEPDEDAAVERRREREQVAVPGAQDEGRLSPAQHVRLERPAQLLRRRVLGADQVPRPCRRLHRKERRASILLFTHTTN